jgi:hypothetical protein
MPEVTPVFPRAERVTRLMARRSDRHCLRPIAALALDAGTTIGPQCATIHDGQEDETLFLHSQAGYTTAPDTTEMRSSATRLTTGRSPYTGC